MNKAKSRMYIITLQAVVIVSFLFYLEVFYVVEKVKSISFEIIEQKQTLKRINEQNKKIKDIRRNYENTKKNMDIISNSIVKYENIVNFIIEIENAADKAGIKLNINVRDKEKREINKDLSYIVYNIETVGNFENVMRFLSYVENLKYYNKIENIEMSKDELSNSSFISVNITTKVYVR